MADTVETRTEKREDVELYSRILEEYEMRKKHNEDRGIYKDANENRKIYENDPWGALGIKRPYEDLSMIAVPVGTDAIETGLSVATASIPMPDVQPEIPFNDPELQKALQAEEALAQQNAEAGPGGAAEALIKPESPGPVSPMAAYKQRIFDYAARMQRHIVKHWVDFNCLEMIRKGYREKGKLGDFIIKSEFNPEHNRIEDEICELESVLPAIGIDSIEGHVDEMFIYAPVMTVAKAKRMFGIEDLDGAARGKQEDLLPKGKTTLKRGLGAIIKSALSGAITLGQRVADKLSGKLDDKKDFCVVIFAWIPDTETQEEYETDEIVKDESGAIKVDPEKEEVVKQPVKKNRLFFKSGYKKVAIIKGHENKILLQEDCPYKRNGLRCPPFIKMTNSPQANDFWGVSEFALIKDLMMRFMLTLSNLHDNVRLTGNPKLVMPSDARQGGAPIDATNAENDVEDEEITSTNGEIIRCNTPNGVYYLNVPASGYDAKWLIETFMAWMDRALHMSDALRGFNQYSQDSGRKVRELRAAALGTFLPKLEEVVNFCRVYYGHIAWIYQNLWQGQFVQYEQDKQGSESFVMFDPSYGRGISLHITVSSRSLLPHDPDAEFEQLVTLYNMGQKRTMLPLVPAEMVVDGATLVRDQARAKAYLAQSQQEQDVENMKAQALQQFQQLVQESQNLPPGSPEEETMFGSMLQLIQQVPDLMNSPDMQVLPDRVKDGIVAAIRLGMDPAQGEGMDNAAINKPAQRIAR